MEQLMQQIFDFFSVAGRETALFIVSMIPLIELRGSIPLGAAMGMDWHLVFLISIAGNLLPVPFIVWFGRPLFKWLKSTKLLSGVTNWYEQKLLQKADKVTRYEAIGLCLFVGVPLPGTGAWSGAAIARYADEARHPFDRGGRADRRGDHDGGLLWPFAVHQPVLTSKRRCRCIG